MKKNIITLILITLTSLDSFSVFAEPLDSSQLFGTLSAGFYDSNDLDSEDLGTFNSLESGIKLNEQISAQSSFIFNKNNVDIALSTSYYHVLNEDYALMFDAGIITNKVDDKISPLFGIGFSASVTQNTDFIFKATSFSQNDVYAGVGLRFYFTGNESRQAPPEENSLIQTQNDSDNTLESIKSCRDFYVVQEGEHLWSIARKIGMNPVILTSYNFKRFINIDVLHAGDTLCLN
ncbi:LysM peptidoglycan-binding domain-containing protein [Vibrio owensii]|uniref:LysM peptidoglycan-binding domain-containing protein n=1 Tax=Vibrio owensii TaxID=696485 RepID=UPI00039C6EFB|nr:LysM peptidoglycan-binding domain-containing protein [Vibrio owensii]